MATFVMRIRDVRNNPGKLSYQISANLGLLPKDQHPQTDTNATHILGRIMVDYYNSLPKSLSGLEAMARKEPNDSAAGQGIPLTLATHRINTIFPWQEPFPHHGEFVYFLSLADDPGVCKIGATKNFQSRLVSHYAATPFQFNLLLLLPIDLGYEAAIHRHFQSLWIKGEWFHYAGKLYDFVAYCKENLESIVKRSEELRQTGRRNTRRKSYSPADFQYIIGPFFETYYTRADPHERDWGRPVITGSEVAERDWPSPNV